MTQEEQRERVIQDIADMLRRNPFTCEFKVKKERLKYDWKKLPVVRKVECRDDIYGYKFAELWVV